MTYAKPVVCVVDGSADVSGAFVAVRRQAELMGDEAEFVLLTSAASRIQPEQLTPFARVYRLPLVSLRRSAGSAAYYLPALLRCGFQMRRILKKERSERLQFNDFHFAHGIVLRALGYRGLITTWVRLDPIRFGKVGKLWLASAHRTSKCLVAVSEFIKKQIALPGTAVVFDPVPEIPVVGPNAAPTLVFMGSYQPLKGQDVAIAAFHRIAAKHPKAKLLFYGSDMGLPGSIAFLGELRALAGCGEGRDQIEFRPVVKDPVEALREARAALCMSRNEPFGLVCQEASAYGLPVIATRSGGPEEIIEDGVTGYLVDVDDHEAVADRMDRLLSDVALARRLGLAGSKLVRKRFPVDRFKAQLRDLFEL